MSTKIVFVADDFGLSDSVNDAMIHSHRHGVLSGAALMLGQAGTGQAIDLARDNPELEIGWHLHVVDSKPLSCDEWPWKTPTAAGFAIGFSRRARELVRKEIELQWEAYLKSGLRCSFVNAHHHLCIHPFVRKTLLETLGQDYDGWLRWGRPRFFGPKQAGYGILDKLLQEPQRSRIPYEQSSTLWGIDRTFVMNADEVAAVLPTLEPGLHEFMFHPRQIEADKDTQCLVDLKNMAAVGDLSPAL